MIAGHPALRYLARAKLAGSLRKQKRRLKTPKGALLALLGLGVIGLWFLSLLAPSLGRGTRPSPAPAAAFEVALVLLGLLSVSNALSHRGLYVPPGEIERLFSAPVSRADLVRHRMLAAIGRSLIGALFLGLLAMRHAPVALFGFLGAVLTTLSLPILSQGVSLLAGDAENRLTARLARLPRGWLHWGLTLLLAAGVASMFLRGRRYGRWMDGTLERALGFDPLQIVEHPIAQALLAPMQPWSRMLTATEPASFALWLAACAAAWWIGFELVARIPIDYRELSLATASDVAKRIQRLRRGATGAGATSAPLASRGWRVPWLFGRGPSGALAWRKLASMVRKSRSTLLTGSIVLAAVVFMSVLVFRNKPQPALAGTLMIVLAGTPYLCGALRFDFREDLDAMPVIKSWPVAPWRIFMATLAPGIALVSALLVLGVVVRALATDQWSPILAPALLAIPLVVGAWLAIDNAAFLIAPVRLVPGQEGALQNAGRTMLLMLLRMLAFLAFTAIVGVPVGFVWLLHKLLGFDRGVLIAIASTGGFLAALAALASLIWIGGRCLSSFDVARDRA